MPQIYAAEKRTVSVKFKTIAIVAAIVASVVIPQFFHWMGKVSGLGMAFGIAFSPMHFPVMIVGFIGGPLVGAIVGFLGPAVSYLISGMPNLVQLPFMMIELFGYGLCAGLLMNIKLPNIVKTVIVMIAGRVLRMLACIFAFYLLHNEKMAPLGIWRSIPSCLPGIVMQLVIIPLAVFRFENRSKE